MAIQVLTLSRLIKAVDEDAAIRRIRRLQPSGGPGDKIFPPTYPGARTDAPPQHVFEYRRIGAEDVLCVLVDSVQSQANRLEEALSKLRQEKKVWFPTVSVHFENTGVADIGSISALEAPHRVYDAILRDSELDRKPFRDTKEGQALALAKPQNAAALFELAPTALVFGAWNSTGEGGGLGAKFPRAIVSEIVGVHVATEPDDSGRPVPSGKRPGSRIDPLGIRSGVKVWKMSDGTWSIDAPANAGGTAEVASPKAARNSTKKEKKEKKGPAEVRPSEINHSNIAPTIQQLGVSVDYLQHTLVISLAALRRLRFATTGNQNPPPNSQARAALAAVALTSALAQDRTGYFLRSRCDLVPVPDASVSFKIVRADGTEEDFELTLEGAAGLVKEASTAAAKAGLAWREEDLNLQPQKKLLDLVAKSRALALQGVGDADNEA